MSQNDSLKPLMLNILIAFSGFGLLVLAGKAIYSKHTTGQAAFFFATTNKQEKIAKVADALNKFKKTANEEPPEGTPPKAV